MTGPSKQYKPFPAVTCERIRRLLAERAKSEEERREMFEARDKSREDLAALTRAQLDGAKASPQKQQQIEADYGRCILEIDRLAKTIKWCNNEISAAVKNADKPGLFDDADVKVPDFRNPESEEPEDGDGEGAPKKTETRPVGRPGKKPPATEPALPDGEDQHLNASVNELDLREDLKGKLLAAGIEKVGTLQECVIGGKDIQVIVSVSEKDEKLIAAACVKFIKAHRKAKAETA